MKAKQAKAVTLVRSWAGQKLQGCAKPARAGTPRGEPIGFSPPKYEAAYLQVLYPHGLRLREIADIAGINQNTLRVWHTQNEFKKVAQQASVEFGREIAQTIIVLLFKDAVAEDYTKNKTTFTISGGGESDSQRAGLLIETLPFYNKIVATTIIETFSKDLKHLDQLRWGMLINAIERVLTVHDDESKRKFVARPEVLLVEKLYICKVIDELVDPKTWEQSSLEEIQESAKVIEERICDLFDILAS